MKNKVLILGILILIVATLGCTDNTQQKKQSGDVINFQMPEGWELHDMPGDGIVIWMGSDPRIRIIEMEDKKKFDSKHSRALNIDNTSYIVRTKNETVDGITVEVFKTIDGRYGDIQDQYFFYKNNKYYYMVAWAYTGWDSGKQNKDRQEISKAVDIIVKTIN
jgi:hypothetical protein